MFRNITKNLVSWKDSKYRKPLLLRGARQVGKTYAVEQFAAEFFSHNFIKFDFEARPELIEIFKESLEPHILIPKLEIFSNKLIDKKTTLIFFDEIQACPNAIISLRYFFEQAPEMHVIAAGSLLEFALADLSFPVGRVNLLHVYPMNFSEFLKANNKNKILDIVTDSPRILSDSEHQFILKEFVNFLTVGGFPESVKRYTETNSVQQTFIVQQELVETYKADFSKYAGRASLECLMQVFNSLPNTLAKPLKYSQLSNEYTVPTIKNSVELLTLARVIKKISNINPHGLPLAASASNKLYKLILTDLGLLHGISKYNLEFPINSEKILSAYRGTLAEQVIGQALIEQFQDNVYTWYRPSQGSQAEVDFIVENSGIVYPIEVKSGTPGKLKSMQVFLKEHNLSKCGIVVSTDKYQIIKNSKLVYLPIYYLDNIYNLAQNTFFTKDF